MTTERFIVDDAGTLIDMHTRDMFDIVEEVCPLLNEQHETIQRLKQNIDELLSVDIEEKLLKENEQLRNRLKVWHQKTFKAHEYFNILEKVIDDVCDDEISNQIWKEYEKKEQLIE